MALDDEDKKEIAKLVNSAFTAREERSEKKTAEIVAAALKAHAEAQEEAARVRKAEEAEKAEKGKEQESERMTLAKLVKQLEEEKRQAKEEARNEKAAAAFRAAWGSAKFAPELADEHMAFLRTNERFIVEEDGPNVKLRVRDPNKSKHETQPTLDEYIGSLSKSERGKFYQAPSGTPGQGGTSVSAPRQEGQRMTTADANEAIFGVRIG